MNALSQYVSFAEGGEFGECRAYRGLEIRTVWHHVEGPPLMEFWTTNKSPEKGSEEVGILVDVLQSYGIKPIDLEKKFETLWGYATPTETIGIVVTAKSHLDVMDASKFDPYEIWRAFNAELKRRKIMDKTEGDYIADDLLSSIRQSWKREDWNKELEWLESCQEKSQAESGSTEPDVTGFHSLWSSPPTSGTPHYHVVITGSVSEHGIAYPNYDEAYSDIRLALDALGHIAGELKETGSQVEYDKPRGAFFVVKKKNTTVKYGEVVVCDERICPGGFVLEDNYGEGREAA